MRVVSVNVGLPRAVFWKGRSVRTSIFKEPVRGPVQVRNGNLDGDGQADLTVHGGEAKAVYGYPAEHYAWWRDQLPDVDLDWGAFGENLTTEGVSEATLHVGDRLRIGGVVLRVTEPRMPCFKLGIRLEREDVVERFLHSGRSGFYFAIEREGEIRAGDRIEVVEAHPARISIAEIARLQAASGDDDVASLRRAAELDVLPEKWRKRFTERMRKLGAT